MPIILAFSEVNLKWMARLFVMVDHDLHHYIITASSSSCFSTGCYCNSIGGNIYLYSRFGNKISLIINLLTAQHFTNITREDPVMCPSIFLL